MRCLVAIPKSLLLLCALAAGIYRGDKAVHALVALPRGITPTVATFAYDAMRSGHVVSHVNSKYPLALEEIPFPLGKGASRRIKPLYINGLAGNAPPALAGLRVLIFGVGTRILAVDVDRSEVLWKEKIPRGYRMDATPVLDLERGWIYFYARRVADDGIEYRYSIHQIRVDGRGGLTGFEIDLNELNIEKHPDLPARNRHERLFCKTAMGINDKVSPHYVFFACSIHARDQPGTQYGSVQGISGLLLAFELDAAGRLKGPAHSKVFQTSVVHPSATTGYDTGIYNLGSGPALLPDASILVATGNGPVFLEKDNYGCSVVRLDGGTLAPMKHPDGTVMAFSRSAPPYNECWYQNNEYASSAVSVAALEGGLIASIMSKDGYLTLFDPEAMKPDREGVTEIRVGRIPTYGQPVMIRRAAGVRVFAGGTHTPYSKRHDTFLAPGDMLPKLADVENTQCYGWLARSPEDKGRPLALMYSGPFRDEYANAVKGSRFYEDLVSFFSDRVGHDGAMNISKGLWGPYAPVAELGFSLPPRTNFKVENAQVQPLESVGRFLESTKLEETDFPKDEFFILRNMNPARRCQLDARPSLVPVYLVVRSSESSNEENDVVVAFDIEKDRTVTKAWSYRLRDEEKLRRVHLTVSTDPEGKHPVLVVLTRPKYADHRSGDRSSILLLDGDTGEEIARAPFKGVSHFSMPLVFDEKIVVPTWDGLVLFSVTPKMGR